MLAEEVSETEFEVAHPQYALDGALTQFAGQGQNIRGERPLTDGEMGIPGPKPSKAQLEEWLEPKEDEEEMPLDEAIEYIKKKLEAKRKTRKTG